MSLYSLYMVKSSALYNSYSRPMLTGMENGHTSNCLLLEYLYLCVGVWYTSTEVLFWRSRKLGTCVCAMQCVGALETVKLVFQFFVFFPPTVTFPAHGDLLNSSSIIVVWCWECSDVLYLLCTRWEGRVAHGRAEFFFERGIQGERVKV